MNLNEAITHAEEKGSQSSDCAADHRQLAEWLKEYREMRKALETIAGGMIMDLLGTVSLGREEMQDIAKIALGQEGNNEYM